ncbi:cytochrome P450 [Zhongshania sp.]|uniref:cytochrome P450 n=1 Tax=Zhongshania sp. TaxID=1971902 RepID=UPI0035645E20
MTTDPTRPVGVDVPDHVPENLVWRHSIDEFTRELDDPYLAGARLHNGPDIIWAQNAVLGKPAWVLTRHALIQEAYLAPDVFSSDRQNLALLGVDWKLNPLEYDPPEHQAYRKILNPFFTPRAMAELDVSVREVCDTLIAKFADLGGCEFISEFAEQFPSYIFLDFMGMPRDKLNDFLEWERVMIQAADPMKKFTAMKSVLTYMETYVEEQRNNPTTDLMKGLFSARMDNGSPLSEGEIMGMCYLLYIGGLDTVFSALGWILRHLALDNPLQERLRANPQDIPQAVEELMRAYPVATTHREVKRDIHFHGVDMRVGDWVLFPTFLAARDPRVYDNPHVVDIDRRARHITFATGPHLCLGVHLARRELKTVVEAFLSRFKNIRIASGEHYSFHTGGVFGVDRLPLEWDAVSDS